MVSIHYDSPLLNAESDMIDIDNCEVKVEGAPENYWLFLIHHIFTDQRIGWAVI